MMFIWIALATIAVAIATVGLRKAGVSFNFSSMNLGGLNSILSNRWIWGVVTAAVVVGCILLLEPSKGTMSLILGFAVLGTLAILAVMGRGGVPAKLGLGLLALCLLFFGARAPDLLEKVQKTASEVVLDGKPVFSETETRATSLPSAPPTPLKQEKQAKWEEKATDGSLPVGVWSESVKIEPGCSVRFAGGYGIIYVSQYRFYDKEWKDQELGTQPMMSEFRFKILREGETSLPYTTSCH